MPSHDFDTLQLTSFQERRRFRKPRLVTVWPRCLACGTQVEAVQPQIRQGDEFQDGPATWRKPDEVVGTKLSPCGHVARTCVFIMGEARVAR